MTDANKELYATNLCIGFQLRVGYYLIIITKMSGLSVQSASISFLYGERKLLTMTVKTDMFNSINSDNITKGEEM